MLDRQKDFMQAVGNPLSRQRVRQIGKGIKVLRIGLGQNDFAGFEILIKVSEQFSEAAVTDLPENVGLGGSATDGLKQEWPAASRNQAEGTSSQS